MNYSDSERFEKILKNNYLNKVNSIKNADVVIFNTCSVRQKAEDRILGLGPVIKNLKENNPNLVTILTGCMARRMWDSKQSRHNKKWKTKLKKQMPWLDYIVETMDFPCFMNAIIKKNKMNDYEEFFDIIPKYKNKFQAYLPISTGCDHFCAYCIVPYARGREVCRSFESIHKEYSELIKNGYKDITLVGQIVNRWTRPKDKIQKPQLKADTQKLKEVKDHNFILNFLELLTELDKVPGDYWLSFTSPHPQYFSDELIEFFGKARHLRPFINLPLQSGNDEILKRMNRNYSYEEYKNIILKLRKALPDIVITTDIIVGFPGETEKQFLDTQKAMKELKFDMAYINEYSERHGTKASLMKDDVSHKEKEKRKYILNEILRKTSREQKEAEIGKILKCLPYKVLAQKTICKTINNRDVLVFEKIPLGVFLNIKITGCTDWALKGRIFRN